jgi:hypothetical protein
MADHVRKQVRDAIVTALTGLTTTQSRVFRSRVYPLQVADLPGLCVQMPVEETSPSTIHVPALQERNIDLAVSGYAEESAVLDDELDTIAKEVETALSASLVVSGVNVEPVYVGMDTEFDGEAEKPHGVIRIRYRVRLFTAANAPDTLL